MVTPENCKLLLYYVHSMKERKVAGTGIDERMSDSSRQKGPGLVLVSLPAIYSSICWGAEVAADAAAACSSSATSAFLTRAMKCETLAKRQGTMALVLPKGSLPPDMIQTHRCKSSPLAWAPLPAATDPPSTLTVAVAAVELADAAGPSLSSATIRFPSMFSIPSSADTPVQSLTRRRASSSKPPAAVRLRV